MFKHIPVMLTEVVAGMCKGRELAPLRFLDCTIGGAGHSTALLNSCANAQLVGTDLDINAVAAATVALAPFGNRATVVHSSYAHYLDRHAALFDGILADLGVSSHQLDVASRGFSFRNDGPLDMRFDQSATNTQPTAAQLVHALSEADLAMLFETYGEEPLARRLANEIVRRRQAARITTTTQIAEIARQVYQSARKPIAKDPATRIFQALRIAVNNEMATVQKFLEVAPSRLALGGRLIVLTFHSLEDRLVKRRFDDLVASKQFIHPGRKQFQKPSEQEIAGNARSRSVTMRMVERVR